MLKLAFVAVVLLIAAYNKFRLTPWLRTHASAAESLRLTIVAELGVIACVLVVTAVLTTYFAPESYAAASSGRSRENPSSRAPLRCDAGWRTPW